MAKMNLSEVPHGDLIAELRRRGCAVEIWQPDEIREDQRGEFMSERNLLDLQFAMCFAAKEYMVANGFWMDDPKTTVFTFESPMSRDEVARLTGWELLIWDYGDDEDPTGDLLRSDDGLDVTLVPTTWKREMVIGIAVSHDLDVEEDELLAAFKALPLRRWNDDA